MMKEFKLESIDPLSDLKNKIWDALNLIRGYVDVNEYHFILFLLTLQREDVLSEVALHKNDLKIKLETSVYNFAGDNSQALKEIYGVYHYAINKINDKLLFEMIHLFRSLNQSLLKEHFPEIFDDILYKLSRLQGKLAGEYMLPVELSRFVCNLADLPINANVYNPFAGLASFGVFLNGGVNYLGQEINQTTWAIGSLRILAYARNGFSRFLVGDSINDWNPTKNWILNKPEDILVHGFEKQKFDLIISNPPYGVKLQRNISGQFGDIRSFEHFLIERGIEDLKPDGKLIAVISQGFLFRSGGEQSLRKHLIESDLLEMVISFPGGLLTSTNIPFSVLVINKRKSRRKIVRLIDATKFIETTGREKRLNDYALSSFIRSGRESEISKLVDEEAIKELDYNLSLPRYFQQPYEGVTLGTLITPMRNGRSNVGDSGKLIKVKDLKEDAFDYNLNIELLEVTEVPSRSLKIEESCLLIASVGVKLKATYFTYTGTLVYLNSNILAFKIDASKVDIEYLIHELYSANTVNQINSLYTGTAISRLRKEDVLSIKIEVFSLLEQKAKVKGLKEEHIRNRESQLSIERKLLGFKDDAFREFASMKHTFRQYLNALKSNVSGTNKFIARNANEPINLNSIYSKNLNRTFGEHLISLEGTIDSMSKLLTSIDSIEGMQEPIESDLKILIEEAQNRFSNHEIFEFERLYVDMDSFSQIDGEYIAPIVCIHPDDFFRVFSNIISNAIEHGFKGKSNNIIRTSLSFDVENLFCVLEISNNGIPMDKAFTLKHLTTRGEKTSDSKGSGIGGADIKSIVEKNNGIFDIRRDEKAEFSVTYIISLPLVVYPI